MTVLYNFLRFSAELSQKSVLYKALELNQITQKVPILDISKGYKYYDRGDNYERSE